MNKKDRLYKLFQGSDTAVWAHDEIVNQDKRIAELEKTLKVVKKDLLMRAEEDSEGCKVVELSSSVWIQLKEALK